MGGFDDHLGEAVAGDLAVGGLRTGVLHKDHDGAVGRPFGPRDAPQSSFHRIGQRGAAFGLEPQLDRR